MTTWPLNRFVWPHSVRVDHEQNLWLVDVLGHRVHKTTKGGEALLTLGTGETPAESQLGAPFNRPTDVAVSPRTGDVYVSDGYRNSRVHCYDAAGAHKFSWGEPGSDPGTFSLPHNIHFAYGDDPADAAGDHLLVADRENHRVQCFGMDGSFRHEFHVHHVAAVTVGRGRDRSIYCGEQGPPPVNTGVRNLGHRVSIYDPAGKLVTRIGAPLPGEHPEQFLWPHSVAVDSRGDVYVAEVSYAEVGRKQGVPREMVSLRKWRRVSG